MQKSLAARISTLLAGVLFCLGSSVLAQAGGFTITLDKAHPTVKMDALSGAGNWNYSVTVVSGKVSSLSLQIKEDGIGSSDFCWGTSYRRPIGTILGSAENIAAATVEACGPDFPDDNGDPLNFKAFFSGDVKAVVTIEVVYPDPLVALNHSVTGTASQYIVPTASQEVWAFRRRSLRL